MFKRAFSLALLAVLPLTAACDDEDETLAPEQEPSIVEVARAAGSFNTLLTALDEAELTETLDTGGPFTVFAPTDAAFEQIPPADLDAILADQDLLTSILTYHVVPGRLTAEDVVAGGALTTLNGQSLSVQVVGSTVQVGSATVSSTDIGAENGIIHVIDAVLVPTP